MGLDTWNGFNKMDEKDAEQEAVRMRSLLEKIALSNDIQPTAEDYEEASKAIDDFRDGYHDEKIDEIFRNLPLGQKALTILKAYFGSPDPEFRPFDEKIGNFDEENRLYTAVREKVWEVLNSR